MKSPSKVWIAIALTTVAIIVLIFALIQITGTDRWGTPLVLLGIALNFAILYVSKRRPAKSVAGSQEL